MRKIVTRAKPQRLPKVVRYLAQVRAGCKAVGIPEPVTEFSFALPRKWRFDFAWTAEECGTHQLDWVRGVALEVDGGIWLPKGRHNTGAGLLAEHEKMNNAAMRGWLIFRTTPKGVGDLALYRMIAEAFSGRVSGESA